MQGSAVGNAASLARELTQFAASLLRFDRRRQPIGRIDSGRLVRGAAVAVKLRHLKTPRAGYHPDLQDIRYRDI
jgi:hypothetical protein